MIGDVLTLEMRGEAVQLQKTLDGLNKEAKDLRKTIAEIEKNGGKGSEEWQKYKNQLKETQQEAQKLAKELKTMDVSKMTMRQLEQHAKDLAKELKNADRSSQDFAKNAKRLGEVEKELGKAKKQAADLKNEGEGLGKPGLWSKISTGAKSVGTAFQGFLALQVVQWLFNVGKAVFDTTAKFEGYEKSLAATYQATMKKEEAEKAAAASMKALAQIAKDTPLTLDEVTKGYVSLATRGLRPGEEQMKRLIDVSTKSRLPLDQLGEAIKDINNNERWSEFGIKVKTSGDKISTTVNGVTQSFERSEQGAMDMVVALGSVPGTFQFAGQAMDSLGGKSSNVEDAMGALMRTIGTRLAPIFMALLSAIETGINWLGELIDASDPVTKVFEDIYEAVGDVVSSFMHFISSIIPDFIKGGVSLDSVMKYVAIAFRAVLTPTHVAIGALRLLYDAMAGVVEGAKGLYKAFTGDLAGAAESFAKSKSNFASIGTHATDTFEKIKKGWTEAFVDQPQKDSTKAALAAETAEEKRQRLILDAQRKAQDAREEAEKKAAGKREKSQQKTLELIAQLEGEHDQQVAKNSLETEEAKIQEKKRKRLKEVDDSLADEKTKEKARALIIRNADAELHQVREKDNKKALELMAQLEAEHDQKVADNSLEIEESKIREKQRKRTKEIQDSRADEAVKAQAIEAINRTAEADLEKVRLEFRQKRQKADDEAAQKRLEAENVIREQERRAEAAVYDFREMQARGNATKLAAIRKERLDTELRLTQEKLAAEMLAEQAKATRDIADAELLARTLNAIDDRYQQESLLATAQAAEKKKAIDKDLHEQKQANRQAYSNMFSALLRGDVDGFVSAAQSKVQHHKAAWQEKLSADMGSYQMGADMAQQAVNFLNDLAQRRAERAIALANQERDEKVVILQNELSVTESLISSHSQYVTDLKTAEKDRLAELQRVLTSETASEEEKRDAMKRYYSEQLQQMKEAEEQKIADLQRMANLAKTEDEKAAIEAKIAMAKEESAEKIRLAEEELEAKKATIDELSEFTTETTEAALTEAKTASEKQVTMAEDEAVKKASMKEELEELIAAENRKARATEAAEKKKAWEAQKKADIATALITGALAILKALANFFPLNIVLAAVAGVTTAIQINKIKNQPMPSFDHGGFVAQGGKHGSQYGDGGIALIDRASGREVGEMEGDEAIISAKQTAANWPLIQRMFQNARTPGKAAAPVADLAGAPPMAFRDGGRFESPYFERGMYLFGGKKKKAEAAAREAEQEAAKAQADADAAMGDLDFDGSAYGGVDGGGAGITGDTGAAQAAHEAAQRQGEKQLELLQGILEETEANGSTLTELVQAVKAVKGAVDSVQSAVQENVSATRGVEGAVNAANTHGRFSELIGAISSLGG
ncbi:hypothetical protein GCM10027275_50460 [Rhabdobacter roseus]|uniref:Tape measure protein n=1 Tax=Rhabdobacter roseus TaxID=1655419 RepID=A0A840U5M0_9BACT|nr:hypothetical protein [Rhabdobacter roseus]MBB5287119.1 hypothetical protein [Rhabdobacter roseus]